MWKRDFPATYKALNAVKWSETVADIMRNILGNSTQIWVQIRDLFMQNFI